MAAQPLPSVLYLFEGRINGQAPKHIALSHSNVYSMSIEYRGIGAMAVVRVFVIGLAAFLIGTATVAQEAWVSAGGSIDEVKLPSKLTSAQIVVERAWLRTAYGQFMAQWARMLQPYGKKRYGKCFVRVNLNRSGTVTKRTVKTCVGDPMLKQEAKRMLAGVTSFSAPPTFVEEPIIMDYPIAFQ